MLQFTRLRFYLQAVDRIRLPDYPGSALRGLFGHGLRAVACVTRQPSCKGCALTRHCAHALLFETPLDATATSESLPGGSAAPHPLVFDFTGTRREADPGQPLCFDMTLVGEALSLFPYLIHAWSRAGEQGLGKDRARFQLERVDQQTYIGADQWTVCYTRGMANLDKLIPSQVIASPMPGSVTELGIAFTAPFRAKHHGKLIGPSEFSPQYWLRSLFTRMENLRALYHPGGQPLNLPQLMDWAGSIRITTKNLRWQDWTRHSSRQRSLMQLGGLMGSFHMADDALEPLHELIWLGQWLHAGKATSFGLGAYRILPEGVVGE